MKGLSAVSLFFLFCLLSCGHNEEPYPAIITEFSNIRSNIDGVLVSFTTDRDQTFRIANRLAGYDTCSTYRAVCGYVANSDSVATVYQLYGAWYLRDSTSIPLRQDPVEVLSVWRTRRYLNMQLSSRTQGGRQYWGFRVDSVQASHVYLSLYHNQNDDVASYPSDVYASLPLDSVKALKTGDSLSFTAITLQGPKTWKWLY
jgi:hypothetical protein